MPPRFFVAAASLDSRVRIGLPERVVRHAQVLRCRAGDAVTLFDGSGREWPATIQRIGRDSVEVDVGASLEADRELGVSVTLAPGMPANERMDTLIEKATELGVAAIQPLATERSVLRLDAERAARKLAHWRAIAIAACEQCGRNRIPEIAPVRTLPDWLAVVAASPARKLLLGLRHAPPLAPTDANEALVLSGPEGGLSEDEEALARQHGFAAASLGPRVLRADTAPLAALVRLWDR